MPYTKPDADYVLNRIEPALLVVKTILVASVAET